MAGSVDVPATPVTVVPVERAIWARRPAGQGARGVIGVRRVPVEVGVLRPVAEPAVSAVLRVLRALPAVTVDPEVRATAMPVPVRVMLEARAAPVAMRVLTALVVRAVSAVTVIRGRRPPMELLVVPVWMELRAAVAAQGAVAGQVVRVVRAVR